MLIYFYAVKKYLYYFIFFFLLLLLVLFFRELVNLDFIISVYKEEGNAFKLVFNSMVIFLPFILPIVFFYSTNFWLNFLIRSNVPKRMTLSGNSSKPVYFSIIFLNVLVMVLSLMFNHFLVPSKVYENNFLLRKIQIEKPYITLEPFIFNRIGNDYLVYFKEFGKSKKKIRDVVVYKLKKGRIKNMTHVKNGYIDRDNNLVLSNGLSVMLGESGKLGRPVYLDNRINKNEIIDRGYFNEAFPITNVPDNMTSLKIIRLLKNAHGRTRYYEIYELNRRFSLSFSLLFFLIISVYLFLRNVLGNTGNLFILSSIISLVFILKEIYLKFFLKNIVYNVFINIWLIDALALLFILIALHRLFRRLFH